MMIHLAFLLGGKEVTRPLQSCDTYIAPLLYVGGQSRSKLA
jgi:hypothetical protein